MISVRDDSSVSVGSTKGNFCVMGPPMAWEREKELLELGREARKICTMYFRDVDNDKIMISNMLTYFTSRIFHLVWAEFHNKSPGYSLGGVGGTKKAEPAKSGSALIPECAGA